METSNSMEKNKLQRSWRSGYRVSGRFSLLKVWRRVNYCTVHREQDIVCILQDGADNDTIQSTEREEQIVCALQDGCGE